LALKFENIYREQGKENLRVSGLKYGKGLPTLANPIKKIDTKKELAKISGVSHGTIAKVKRMPSWGFINCWPTESLTVKLIL